MSRTREEAIAAGIQVRETKHNMKRRKPWHNYHLKGTYMLTLVVEGRWATVFCSTSLTRWRSSSIAAILTRSMLTTNGSDSLLQISPWEYHMQRHTISREKCLMLNRLVEAITMLL